MIRPTRNFEALAALCLLAWGCESPPSSPAPSAAASAPPPSCKAQCDLGGLCHWDATRERCAATRDEDCRGSASCRTSGLCTAQSGVCIGSSAEDCRASERCRSHGECSFTERGLRPCAAREGDCKASSHCRSKGLCTAVEGKCLVTSADDCAASEACTYYGKCSAKPTWRGDITVYECSAMSDDDCKKGKVCIKDGDCEAILGDCR